MQAATHSPLSGDLNARSTHGGAKRKMLYLGAYRAQFGTKETLTKDELEWGVGKEE